MNLTRLFLILVAAAIVFAIRVQPLSLGDVPGDRNQLTWHADDGREHVYLGDYDSYLWVREARNYLRSGTTCDTVADGTCRDTFTNAPVGVEMPYGRSLHIAAIVAVHRLITAFEPQHPLTSSAFWVPVVIAILGVVPAFAIGSRLAGPMGGFAAALVINANPYFLKRSVGGDNDVWNVVLPLFAVWATMAALECRHLGRRLSLAALAGFVFGLHAITWSGWIFFFAVSMAALGLTLGVDCIRMLYGRAPVSARVRRTFSVLVTLALVTTVIAVVTGEYADAFGRLLEIPRQAIAPSSPSAASADLQWPDVFATIAELKRSNLAKVAEVLAGPLYLFAAWLGLLVLLLPKRDWQWWHFAVLIGGTLLYRELLTAPDQSRAVLFVLLVLPLMAAVLVAFLSPDEESNPLHPGAVIVAVWFLAGLFKTFDAARFLILVVAAHGLLVGVALGRLHEWLVRVVSPRLVRSGAVAAVATCVVVAPALVLPVKHGLATARAYRPAIHDAWWDTLVGLRETSPSDAVLTTWWDYGHWAKYVAQRRVNADGSTLRTHVPHWVGRALHAETEDETLGLLRMLNCGSDTTPEPEAGLGAWGKLLGYGMDPLEAYAAVVSLASRSAEDARRSLLARGLAPEAVDDVLRSTHCDAPATYVILTSTMIRDGAWRAFGLWDARRPWLLETIGGRHESEVLDDLTTRLQTPQAEARALYDEAIARKAKGDVKGFLLPRTEYAAPDWRACTVKADGAEETWSCPFESFPLRQTLTAVEYRPHAPERTRILTTDGELAPAALGVADDRELRDIAVNGTRHPELGAIVDVMHRRVLVAPPRLLRSTFTQLFFLDARFLGHFEQISDLTGYGGERVRTWRVHW